MSMRRRAIGLVLVGLAAAAVAATMWLHARQTPPATVRVGYRHSPPSYLAPEGAPPGGIAVDTIAAAAARGGVTIKWTRISGDALAPLQSGIIDVWPTLPLGIDTMGLHVTEPWLQSTFVLITREGSHITSARTAAGRRVAHLPSRRGLEDEILRRAVPGATYLAVEDAAVLPAVCSGTADAGFIEGRLAQWLLLNRPPACADIPLAFVALEGAGLSYAIGSTVAAGPVADRLRAEIARMAEDGTLASIQSRWSMAAPNETGLATALERARQRARWSLYGGAALAVALLLSLWQIRRSVQAAQLAEQASRAMKDYASQQERYRLLFERNLAGVFRSTVDGQVLECNDAFARMLGYSSPAEVVAQPALTLYPGPADRQRFVSRVLLNGSVTNVENQVRRRDGSAGWLLENVSVFRQGNGHATVLEGTCIDITEQRRLEEQYRQAQKLESVGRLAGGVAHDFNNLLTAITGHTELLLADVGETSPYRVSLQEIRKASHRAASLTQQLLAFSRKQILQPVVLSINDVVDDTCRLLTRVIGEDIELTTRLDPGAGTVRADPDQLAQVLMNLAVNARDAMPGGGQLTFETRPVLVTPADVQDDADAVVGACVRITVSDTGHGMDAETQRRLFEPFFTTKEQGKGTGLGLSTVYGIVKQSGGHIRLRSEVGKGTRFEIDLPSAPTVADGNGSTAPSQHGSGESR
ncbi:MAG TPA: ATP-binding protein [Vicinamibacterales bacterium]|jgi:PAS domain S-box-containing protein